MLTLYLVISLLIQEVDLSPKSLRSDWIWQMGNVTTGNHKHVKNKEGVQLVLVTTQREVYIGKQVDLSNGKYWHR